MSRRPPRLRNLRAAALAVMASAVGVAYAASLGGVSAGTLDAWQLPATVPTGDVTPPTIGATVSPSPNAAGWSNTSVTVTFTCDDAESGIASCTAPVTVSAETAGQPVTGTAVDVAGNTASATATVRIDLAGPVVDIVGFDDGAYLSGPPAVSCTATDALSGVAGPCGVTTTAGSTPGEFVVTATAADAAGNVTVLVERYRIGAICGVGPTNVPCVIPFGEVVDGHIRWDADVLVLGEVTKKIDVNGGTVTIGATGVVGGNVTQSGPGGVVVVTGGTVDGKIDESGSGSVSIDGVVDGNVREQDEGDLTVGPDAHVVGVIKESGPGSLSVSGTVDKNVEEDDDGDLVVGPGARIGGSAKELGAGSLIVDTSVVDGAVVESDDGALTITGTSSIGGKATESKAGDLTIGPGVVVAGSVDSAGGGVCTISPAATVNGTRRNACAV